MSLYSFSLKNLCLLLLFLCNLVICAQEEGKPQVHKPDSLSLLFIGDIMGHDPQIESAWDIEKGEYDYEGVFEKVCPIITDADIAIANLEVTLAGKPYTGYPQFSSPDALAVAAKNNGIDVLVTANNHSCDKRKKGLIRTLNVLDTLGIAHTGTFRNLKERDTTNLLVLEKNNIRVGLLNYTYGTNGLPDPPGTHVNRIDTLAMAEDIKKSKKTVLDKLIVFMHWGDQYKSFPKKSQRKLAYFLFDKGVDIIIGAHPHVLQPMEYVPSFGVFKEELVVYSLGNYVSNQRQRRRDGGAMVEIVLKKAAGKTVVSDHGFHLTWVHKPVVDGKTVFEILPCAEMEANDFEGMDAESIEKMKLFIEDSRTLLATHNKNFKEVIYSKPKKELTQDPIRKKTLKITTEESGSNN